MQHNLEIYTGQAPEIVACAPRALAGETCYAA